MAEPARSLTEIPEERLTHGYHHELDRDRNGLPDHMEEEDAEIAEQRRKMLDANHNGIPDYLESNAANDDYALYDHSVHRNSPLDAAAREHAGMVAATYDVEEPARDTNDKVRNANAALAAEILKDESNPKRGDFGRSEITERMKKLRDKRLPKSSVIGEMSRLHQGKTDPDNGFDQIKAIWRGLMQAHLATRRDNKAKRDAAIDEEMQDLRRAERAMDDAEKRAKPEEERSPAATPNHTEPEKDGGNEPDQGSGGASNQDELTASANKAESPDASKVENNTPALGTPASQNIEPEAAKQDKSQPASDKGLKPQLGTESTAKGGEAIGNSALGMAVSAVNPAAGVAISAVQANETQKEQGVSFTQNEGGKIAKRDDKPVMQSPFNPVKANVANDRAPRRTLSLAKAPDASNLPKKEFGPVPPSMASSARRQGPIFDLAKSLPLPKAPVQSIAPSRPVHVPKIVGLGSGVAIFTNAMRAAAPVSQELQQLIQKSNDRESNTRTK